MTELSGAFREARKRVALAEAMDALFNNGLTKANLEVQRWALGRCPDCGRYWLNTEYMWEPLRWWHFRARRRIKTDGSAGFRHDSKGGTVSDVYALKQPGPGGEWIQEHDSLADALRYQEHSGGVLVRREVIPGEPGLWWVEVQP